MAVKQWWWLLFFYQCSYWAIKCLKVKIANIAIAVDCSWLDGSWRLVGQMGGQSQLSFQQITNSLVVLF